MNWVKTGDTSFGSPSRWPHLEKYKQNRVKFFVTTYKKFFTNRIRNYSAESEKNMQFILLLTTACPLHGSALSIGLSLWTHNGILIKWQLFSFRPGQPQESITRLSKVLGRSGNSWAASSSQKGSQQWKNLRNRLLSITKDTCEIATLKPTPWCKHQNKMQCSPKECLQLYHKKVTLAPKKKKKRLALTRFCLPGTVRNNEKKRSILWSSMDMSILWYKTSHNAQWHPK